MTQHHDVHSPGIFNQPERQIERRKTADVVTAGLAHLLHHWLPQTLMTYKDSESFIQTHRQREKSTLTHSYVLQSHRAHCCRALLLASCDKMWPQFNFMFIKFVFVATLSGYQLSFHLFKVSCCDRNRDLLICHSFLNTDEVLDTDMHSPSPEKWP